MLRITHPPQSKIAKICDMGMLPLMYLLQGNFREVPQQTHYWNNQKYSAKDITFLSAEMMVTVENDVSASPRWAGFLPIFHMPIFGGWRNFVVVNPVVSQDVWYVGWVAGDVIGISQISLVNEVRVLRGPSVVQFFGINEHGQQIDIEVVAEGKIGVAGEFSKTPLL